MFVKLSFCIMLCRKVLPCLHKWAYYLPCTIGVLPESFHFLMPRNYTKAIKPLKKIPTVVN